MKNIGDLALFRKFVLLCAGRIGLSPADCTLVYGGEEKQARSAGRVLPWRQAHLL